MVGQRRRFEPKANDVHGWATMLEASLVSQGRQDLQTFTCWTRDDLLREIRNVAHRDLASACKRR